MSQFANWKSIKLKGTRMGFTKDGRNEYSIRVEYKKNFVHVQFISTKLDVDGSRSDLLRAFRDVLLTANAGVMNPMQFAAYMRRDPADPTLKEHFESARDIATKLDSLFDIPHEMGFYEMAKGMAHDGVVPPLIQAN